MSLRTLARAAHGNAAVDFPAPYLIEKLLKDQIVDSATDAEALFREVKRYFVMVHEHPDQSWQMHSLRVDEVWHQFILFTVQYQEYCKRYFGRYIHHAPSNAPAGDPAAERPPPHSTRSRSNTRPCSGRFCPTSGTTAGL